jgi:hypothetical protein
LPGRRLRRLRGRASRRTSARRRSGTPKRAPSSHRIETGSVAAAFCPRGQGMKRPLSPELFPSIANAPTSGIRRVMSATVGGAAATPRSGWTLFCPDSGHHRGKTKSNQTAVVKKKCRFRRRAFWPVCVRLEGQPLGLRCPSAGRAGLAAARSFPTWDRSNGETGLQIRLRVGVVVRRLHGYPDLDPIMPPIPLFAGFARHMSEASPIAVHSVWSCSRARGQRSRCKSPL